MARAYGLDLRHCVIEPIDAGLLARAAVARFSVGASTATKWHQRWRETGKLEAGRPGKPRRFARPQTPLGAKNACPARKIWQS